MSCSAEMWFGVPVGRPRYFVDAGDLAPRRSHTGMRPYQLLPGVFATAPNGPIDSIPLGGFHPRGRGIFLPMTRAAPCGPRQRRSNNGHYRVFAISAAGSLLEDLGSSRLVIRTLQQEDRRRPLTLLPSTRSSVFFNTGTEAASRCPQTPFHSIIIDVLLAERPWRSS